MMCTSFQWVNPKVLMKAKVPVEALFQLPDWLTEIFYKAGGSKWKKWQNGCASIFWANTLESTYIHTSIHRLSFSMDILMDKKHILPIPLSFNIPYHIIIVYGRLLKRAVNIVNVNSQFYLDKCWLIPIEYLPYSAAKEPSFHPLNPQWLVNVPL